MIDVAVKDKRIIVAGDTMPLANDLRKVGGARWDNTRRQWSFPATPFVGANLAAIDGMPLPSGDWLTLEATAARAVFRAQGCGSTADRLRLFQPDKRVFDCWRHQLDALAFIKGDYASYLGMRMGTGKTKVVVDLVNNNDAIRKVLVVCPLSVIDVWGREIKTHAAKRIVAAILNKGDVTKKIKHGAVAVESLKASAQHAVAVVVNYETARSEKMRKWLTGQTWDLVVADEAHRAKGLGPTAKTLAALTTQSGQRLCLSGTPMPHDLLDIFSQYEFLDPGVFGTNYYRFRDQYAICNKLFPSKVERWINQDEFKAKLALFMFQVGDEVLDLPEALHVTRSVDLDSETRRVYDELESDLVSEVDQGTITLSNALVKILRLQQVACGHVSDSDSGVDKRLGFEKQKALMDVLEDLPAREPVVVFCRFRRDIEAIRKAAHVMNRRCGEVSGTHKDLDGGKYPENVDLLVVQVASGGVGIDLTRAKYGIIYSLDWSAGNYDQLLARVRRPGQTRTVEWIHLIADNTIDGDIYDSIRKKKATVENVLKAIKERRAA